MRTRMELDLLAASASRKVGEAGTRRGGVLGLLTTRESTRDRTAAMRARATVSWLPNCKARVSPKQAWAREGHLREMGQLESVSVAELRRSRARLQTMRGCWCDDATSELRPSNSTMSAKFKRPSRLTSPSKIWGTSQRVRARTS